ncbi:hypothetical protein MASSI9I_51280 [Massilia sp. 9I]|nr:hypothetical protein MASSI9I_51280 [Massilia sp. 9I]
MHHNPKHSQTTLPATPAATRVKLMNSEERCDEDSHLRQARISATALTLLFSTIERRA